MVVYGLKPTVLVKRLYILFCLFGFSVIIYGQPANDDCGNAQVISIPVPPSCPNGNGATVSVSGTTNNATPSNPYFFMNGCSTGGNQQAPALDVWYSFVATGTLLHINLSASFSRPNIAIWTGSCASPIRVDCAIGNNTGVLSYSLPGISPGTTYFIQISGNTTTAQGDFSFTIDNDIDCSTCLTSASLIPSPSPVNGTYLPGQTVHRMGFIKFNDSGPRRM